MRTYKKYIWSILILTSVFLLSVPTNILFLKNVGEFLSPIEVARIQQRLGGLHGSAIEADLRPYKETLLDLRKPEVVVLGSSRVLQFRQAFFTKAFTNLGSTVNSARQLLSMSQHIAKNQGVKLVILGLDYWWTHPTWKKVIDLGHRQKGTGFLAGKFELPFIATHWLLDGKFGLDYYRSILGGGFPVEVSGIVALGLNAALRGNGFAADGSYVYNGVLFGMETSKDEKFENTLERIRFSKRKFAISDTMDADSLGLIRDAVSVLRASGKTVVVFVPPVANRIFSELAERRIQYAYVDKFLANLPSIGADAWYDYHDPRRLDVSDCQFIDGFHGGDVVYAEILSRMARDRTIRKFVNTRLLGDIRENGSGRAQSAYGTVLPGQKEVDFLKLGCSKDAPGQQLN